MRGALPSHRVIPVSRGIRGIALFFLAGFGLGAAAHPADRYAADPVHSTIGFAVRHLVLSKVRGEFPEFSGTILYDEEDISKSSVEVTIQAGSIDTGNQERDEHLRSPEFLDVEKHPEITFRSEEIRKEGNGYVAAGVLTIRGVSRKVELPFTILGKIRDPWGNTRIGVEAALTLNRQDYGVSWSKRMDAGGLVVGNQVEIELSLEAVREAAEGREEAS